MGTAVKQREGWTVCKRGIKSDVRDHFPPQYPIRPMIYTPIDPETERKAAEVRAAFNAGVAEWRAKGCPR